MTEARPRRSVISFGVKRGLAIVAALAVGLAALLRPSDTSRALVGLALLIALLTALAGVALCRPESRAFWVGFGVFGWLRFRASR